MDKTAIVAGIQQHLSGYLDPKLSADAAAIAAAVEAPLARVQDGFNVVGIDLHVHREDSPVCRVTVTLISAQPTAEGTPHFAEGHPSASLAVQEG